jgi:hypothetical protein
MTDFKTDFKKIGGMILPIVIEELKKKLEEVWQMLISSYNENSKESMSNVHKIVKEKDLLKKDDLVEAARENIVSGSDGVCAMLKKTDSKVFVFLAYLKDKELLPSDTNTYVILKAEAIARDVEVLFSNNELIILK